MNRRHGIILAIFSLLIPAATVAAEEVRDLLLSAQEQFQQSPLYVSV